MAQQFFKKANDVNSKVFRLVRSFDDKNILQTIENDISDSKKYIFTNKELKSDFIKVAQSEMNNLYLDRESDEEEE